jgi:glyceraldehyde 3-phosphate dehydrogenase
MKKKIAINGFGRIGRNFLRLSLSNPEIEVVAVNDIAPLDIMIHLLKYDSIHGVLNETINSTENSFEINYNKIKYFSEKDPINLPWSELEVDIVIESSGLFKTNDLANKHIIAGAKKVVITAPPDDDSIKTIVLGVNQHLLTKDDHIVSNASCTTNNAAPMIKVIDANFSIESAYITTIHSFTTDQRLHDSPHKDFRRARAATSSIVPTTTGAAKAVTKVFPHLDGIIGGCGMRVPVSNGSLTDITFVISEQTSLEEVNHLFKESSNGSLQNVMFYNNDPIVSVDVVGNSFSCVFDSKLTSVVGKMVKVVGWYDNEIGYSNRLLDLIKLF